MKKNKSTFIWVLVAIISATVLCKLLTKRWPWEHLSKLALPLGNSRAQYALPDSNSPLGRTVQVPDGEVRLVSPWTVPHGGGDVKFIRP